MPSNEEIGAELDNNYEFYRIHLLKESFSRIDKLPFGHGKIETVVTLTFNNTQPDEEKTFAITSDVTIKGSLPQANQGEDLLLFSLDVTFRASFKILGSPPLSLDDFCKINGPAIIFPFLREHVANIAYKAGLPRLILPIASFKPAG